MLVGIREKIRVLGQPFEAVDHEPVLPPQNQEFFPRNSSRWLSKSPLLLSIERCAVFGQIVGAARFGWAGVLSDMLVEELYVRRNQAGEFPSDAPFEPTPVVSWLPGHCPLPAWPLPIRLSSLHGFRLL